MNIESFPVEAGEDQLIVTYINVDQSDPVDPVEVMPEVARDAAERRAAGWRLTSIAVWPVNLTRVMTSFSNFPTQVAVIATYTKAA